MPNPFAIRATEFVRNIESFLSMVSPDPIGYFLQPHAKDDGLFRRLITIQGTPGSGKTTIAKLFEFSALSTLLRGSNHEGYSDIVSAMQKCEALSQGCIRILACRLPLESDYQEIWQLPYDERIKADMQQRLVQARAVLAWFGQLQRTGIAASSVVLVPKENCSDLMAFVGGQSGESVLKRAREVEAAVYGVIGALVTLPEAQIEAKFRDPFRLFDSLEFIQLDREAAQQTNSAERLWPLVILDDAHFLHTPQLQSLKNWLIRREMKIGRWILSRLDVMQPSEVFASFEDEQSPGVPGITTGRDLININLQTVGKRAETRRAFRSMTREISRKYLRQMEIFVQNAVNNLETILPEHVECLAEGNLEKLRKSIRGTVTRLKISDSRLANITEMVEAYSKEGRNLTEDVKLAMVRILLNRYAKRVPQQTFLLDEEPSKPLKADLDIQDGARIHLLHEFDRPYYSGFDALSDAASENAEMFLHLALHIVKASENQLIKQRSPAISAKEQHRLLRERGSEIISKWNFPDHRRVLRLTEWIAERCRARTLEPNAPLNSGANAFGVPWDDFCTVADTHPELASVLKYAVAYNAIMLVPKHGAKERLWCLFELGGILILHHGFTLKRGGFVEGNLNQLAQALISKP